MHNVHSNLLLETCPLLLTTCSWFITPKVKLILKAYLGKYICFFEPFMFTDSIVPCARQNNMEVSLELPYICEKNPELMLSSLLFVHFLNYLTFVRSSLFVFLIILPLFVFFVCQYYQLLMFFFIYVFSFLTLAWVMLSKLWMRRFKA